ncbi:ABC transporter C family member 3-like protein isoform X1 [Cinnamomum micranthum f. kanehirae]|uniref:ABC transporter C family member 3-like protein isoform X1 n=1 Tax=Cinnamomum micranthum f. kanehirae TaxID=337451 RepID=A0A443N1Q3_9MAGN|nr:ABC transporter C family member 3-like protein isoform X1 [Cinnamomum micranthum f. kanehirae]
MGVFHAAHNGRYTLVSFPSPHMQKAFAFLQKPIFLHGFSAAFHLLLILLVSAVWLWKRCKRGGLGYGAANRRFKESTFFGDKATLFTCLSLALFHLILCIYNYCNWYKFGWSDENLATELDLVLRMIAWFAMSAYLQFDFSHSYEKKFPIFLRSWWSFYLLLSCYFIVLDFLYFRKLGILPTHMLVLDFVSVLVGLFLCLTGLFGKRTDKDPCLQEPLLNGSSVSRSFEKSGEGSVTPYANASPFSILTFSWMGQLLKVGHKKTLDLDDVPQVADVDSVRCMFPVFQNKLEEYSRGSSTCTNSSTSCSGVGTLELVKTLIFSVWKDILWTAFLALLYTVCSYVGPYLIDTFVQYLNGHQEFPNEGYVLVSAFLIGKFIECLSQRHWFFKLQQIGMRARAELTAMLYKKALSLSSRSRQSYTSGEIINFMTVDAERVEDFSWYIHDLWMVPIQVLLALVILYKNLGLASVAALVASVLVMLANVPLGKLQERYQEKMMTSKDVRMKATSEILRNMRILKLQGWEMKFLSKIIELRKNETNWLKKYVYTSAMTTFFFWGAPTFVSVVTFGACMLMGIPLESGKVLSALATFRVLQEPIYNLPDTISMAVQAKVSLDRIASFLCLEDLQPDAVQRLPSSCSNVVIDISNGNFSWDPSSANPTLRDLNFKVLRGMRVAVCGTVGSGKSSLLSCILGEVPKISGKIRLCGRKAYVAQSPWIQSGKIEENILFGKEMDQEKYERVLEACSLKKDLDILPFGDQTVIGERGINLSGGQKQRLQIARALYQDADIYLFDDPFSAVDAHTGTHLFKECLLGLLGSKTVIYVTHQVEFLPAADLILVMRDGKITQAGKYSDILNSGTDFMELVGAHKLALSAHDSIEMVSNSEEQTPESFDNGVGDGSSDTGEGICTMQKEREKMDEQNSKAVDIDGQKGQLVQEEEREKGKVGLSVYWKYITTSYKGALVPIILLAQILFQILQIGTNYWMAWATPVSKNVTPPVKGSLLILVYVSLAVGSSFCILIRALLLVTAGYKTATILFNKLHMCIFRAPMSFFDATPSGRILNRASTDQSAVDTALPIEMGTVAFSIIQLLGIIAVMSQVAWQVFIIFIPVIAISIWCQQYYIATARELARLVGVCKAPCIQHFAESLSGSTTIRSFEQEERFMDTNLHLIDGYSRPKFHNAGAMEWLCFRLDMLSSIAFAFSLIFLISLPRGAIDPGKCFHKTVKMSSNFFGTCEEQKSCVSFSAIAGLAVTYGLNLNMLQAWVIWNLCNLENKIISVERLFQYACIPSEPPLVIEANRPDHDWPAQGEVNFCDLQVRYAPHMPLVLRGITCTFSGGMKTGIVGRTGSGKSTLIQTLFRIVDPVGGHILIDGIDISTIGLHDLRSRLSIIPQDPTMFEGTLRSNLDPLEEYTDEQIWEALDRCQLGEEVRSKEGKLDSAGMVSFISLAENGENWSMGQRQLVCLGRVLLKRSKVLVLDEATASVDTATDNLIQQTLRQQFSDSTVITIAHRITSVLNSDMVLLLNNGIIAEYDSPTTLLENNSSAFARLVAEYSVRSSSRFENTRNL